MSAPPTENVPAIEPENIPAQEAPILLGAPAYEDELPNRVVVFSAARRS
jgi:hypothetical protein